MNLCSQLFRHLAKFIVCLVARRMCIITCNHLKKLNFTCDWIYTICVYLYLSRCVCLEPIEMKIDAQLKRIAAASMEISVQFRSVGTRELNSFFYIIHI